MEITLINLLSNIGFFRSLDREEIEAIAANTRVIHLNAGDVLFAQGSASTSIYILIKGELLSYFVNGDQQEKFVSVMEPQEIIGELGVLSGQPRSLTVKAANNNEVDLLEISAEYFKTLCQMHPSILHEIISPLVVRTQSTISLMNNAHLCQWSYIIIDNNVVNDLALKEQLQKHLAIHKKVAFFDEHHLPHGRVNKILYDYSHRFDNVIFWIDKNHLECVNQLYSITGGKIYFVVNADNPDYSLDPASIAIYEKFTQDATKKPYLIILHAADTIMPKGTAAWLKKYKIKQHYHLRLQHDADHARLVRFLLGKAIGLVLGGGGTKVLAHAGLLKALTEKNVIFDAAGGTSSGALVAAGSLLHHPFDVFMKNFFIGQRAGYRSFSYQDLTWPIISLFSGKDITQALHIIYQDIDIEDLWQPFFCITSNLTDFTENVHYTGKLWEKLRASIAIPGILSPMLLDGELHFDGGLINNLPVDVMKSLCGVKGVIIASHLRSTNQHNQDVYSFPPILTLHEAILYKLNLSTKTYEFPPFFEVLLHALLLGAYSREVANSAAAEILINPDLSNYGFIHAFSEEVEQELIKKGYKAGLKQINKHKKILLFGE